MTETTQNNEPLEPSDGEAVVDGLEEKAAATTKRQTKEKKA